MKFKIISYIMSPSILRIILLFTPAFVLQGKCISGIEVTEISENQHISKEIIDIPCGSNFTNKSSLTTDAECMEIILIGNHTDFVIFTPIPREIRSILKSISIAFTSFETNMLLESLEGCTNLETLNLTSVSWEGKFRSKVYLPKLKSFTFSSYTDFTVESSPEMTKYIFFYQQSKEWEQDTQLWANMDIFLRFSYYGIFKISANELSISYLRDSAFLNTVLRSRQIKELSLIYTIFSGEELKYLSGVKSLQFKSVSLLKTSLSEVIQHCLNPENIDIESWTQPEAVDLALISTSILKSLDLYSVSLRWSSIGIPLYFPQLEIFSLGLCDFSPTLVKFSSSLKILNLRQVNILSGSSHLFENLTALKGLDLDVKGEKVVLDISLTPMLQVLGLRNCEIFSSRIIQFAKMDKLIFYNVTIRNDLMKNFSIYFKNAEHVDIQNKIGPLLLTEILKTNVQKLEFYFDWDARDMKAEYYRAVVDYLTSLGVPEGKSNKIRLEKIPSNGTDLKYLDLDYEEPFLKVYKAIFFSVCSVGLIGNTISALVLSRNEMLKLSSSYILLGLALWDSIFVMTSMIQFSLALHTDFDEHKLDEFTTGIFKYLFYPMNKLAYTGSVYLTVLITVDRFIAVSIPLRAKSILTSKRTKKYILFLGVFSVVLNLPRWIESIPWEYPNEGRYWNFYHPPLLVNMSEYRNIYQLYGWSFFMYVLPFGLMMTLNVKIWWEIRRANKARLGLGRRAGNFSDNSVTKMLMSVIMVFLICNSLNALIIWFLINSINSYELPINLGPAGLEVVGAEIVALQPLLVNSSVNFIIYCAIGTKFRAECIQLFRTIFKTCRAIKPDNESAGISIQNIRNVPSRL